jgi:hypothetical protein
MRTKPAAITELPPSPEQEQHSRMLRYALTMGIRVVCIGLCLVTPGWWLLAPALGAVFLPYVAVVIANATTRRTRRMERPIGELPAAPPPRDLP